MYYVYILESQKDYSRYIGMTANLKQRFAEHNRGGAKYSSSKRPFVLLWYCAFISKDKALQFEKYLKSSSGHAFTKKHLL